MRLVPATIAVLGLGLASPATAGSSFFKKDQYDPDTPGFGTPYTRSQLALGMHYTRGLLAEPTHRVAFTAGGEAGILVLPFVTLGARGTWSYLNARVRGPEGFDGFTGYRTFAATVDPVVAVDVMALRVYGFASVVSLARARGTFGSGWPGEGLRYQHFGAGISLRYPMGEAAFGPQIEYRQHTQEVRNGPVDHLPERAVGHTFYVTVDLVTFGGGS